MKYFSLFIAAILITACAPVHKKGIIKSLNAFEEEYQHHSGFLLYDPEKEEYLVDHKGDKYFTPASNTKIVTLFTALRTLGDSIPGLYYVEREDSLIFWGSGDPSLLNELLPESRVFEFLQKTTKELYFSSANYYDEHFGPGWAWDDYMSTYSSEKSPLPVYGNNFIINKTSEFDYLQVRQPYFKQFFWLGDTLAGESELIRDINSNHTFYFPSAVGGQFEEQIPFHYSDFTLTALLSDTLKKTVTAINEPLPVFHKTLYSIPADSAYKLMMQESDNFVAEQLMLVCAGILTDSLKTKKAIQFSSEHYLDGIPDQAVWLDGSGLSRYNLFTPHSIVWIWDQLYKQFSKERLLSLLASGGEVGTLKNYYKSTTPYIYGKTGTLSNNHSLSGFLITKKGKLYIFAFMNNNYPTKSSGIKREMEKILWNIHVNN